MRAMAVHTPGPIETNPLRLVDVAPPEPGPGEILVRVKSCGVCRTDLHVAEGDLKPKHPRIIPGHEIVGVVEGRGEGCKRFKLGARVGIAWLRETCGV
jgi:propanol-preferring alcohol dehydrogenase